MSRGVFETARSARVGPFFSFFRASEEDSLHFGFVAKWGLLTIQTRNRLFHHIGFFGKTQKGKKTYTALFGDS